MFNYDFVSQVAMIYLAEIASKEIRGSLAVINRFMFNFGALLVILIGSFVSYQTLSYMLIVLPVTYFVACLFIPETPYYLLKEGKVDRARKTLMMLNGCKDENVNTYYFLYSKPLLTVLLLEKILSFLTATTAVVLSQINYHLKYVGL